MLNDWIGKSDEEFRDSFFELCTKNKNDIKIKRLFITSKDRITNQVLEYGLSGAALAATEGMQMNNIQIILEMAKKLNIKLEARMSLNIASEKNNLEILKSLDKSLDVIKEDLKTAANFPLHNFWYSLGYSEYRVETNDK